MKIQAHIPVALVCIHNIVHIHDSLDLQDANAELVLQSNDSGHSIVGSIARSVPTHNDREWMSELRDRIAKEMWTSYIEEQTV